MSNYSPDRWQVVKLTYDGEPIYKILGSWYGGYAGSDSWRMSSGVESIKELDECYEVTNSSGSVYVCYKSSVGMSGYTAGVYSNFEKQAAESEGKIQIELVNIEDITEQFTAK